MFDQRVAERARALAPVEVDEGDDPEDRERLALDRASRRCRGSSRCRCRRARRSCSSGSPRRRRPAAGGRASPSFTFELRFTPQPVASPDRSNGVGADVVPLDLADDPRELHVAPACPPARYSRREVGQREARLDVLRARCGLRTSPWSAVAPGRSRAKVSRVSPWIGIQRTWTLRKKTIPFGPQYSSELGNTSMSMNGLQVWPAPNCPSSP